MELEGSISSFDVNEIFQFIGNSRFTGVLNLEPAQPEGKVQVYFDSGRIIGAKLPVSIYNLDELLLKHNKVSRSTLLEISQTYNTRGVPLDSKQLTKALTEQGYLQEEEIRSVVKLQLEEELLNLFRVKKGSFKFDNLSELPVDFYPSVSIEIEPLVIEGNRRNQEWTKYLMEIPSDEIIYAHRKADKSFLYNVNLTMNEWQVFAYVSGKISVRALLKLLQFSPYEIYRSLYNLIKLGLIQQQELYDFELYSKRIEREALVKHNKLPVHPEDVAHNNQEKLQEEGFSFKKIFSFLKTPKDSDPGKKTQGKKAQFETPIGGLIFFSNLFFATLLEQEGYVHSPDDQLQYINLWKNQLLDYPRIDIIKFGIEGLEWYIYERYHKFAGNNAGRLDNTTKDIRNALLSTLNDFYQTAEKKLGNAETQKIYKSVYRNFVSELDSNHQQNLANEIPEKIW